MFNSKDNPKLMRRICGWHVFRGRKLWRECIHTCLLLIRCGYWILVLYKIIHALSGELFVCSWKDYFGVYYPSYAPARKINIKMTLEWPRYNAHGAHLGPTWLLSAPGGPHVGPINLVIRTAHRSVNCLNVKHGQMLIDIMSHLFLSQIGCKQ